MTTGADNNPPPPPPPDRLLAVGTYLSAALAFVCIFGAGALCLKVLVIADGDIDVLVLRLLMSCVACAIAMGFACLGFGLFLIRARGEFRATSGGAAPATAARTIESNAPGLIVVVCATVIMWLALRVRFDETTTTTTRERARPAAGNVDVATPVVPPALTRDPAADGVVMP